jgi:hypothetical protein
MSPYRPARTDRDRRMDRGGGRADEGRPGSGSRAGGGVGSARLRLGLGLPGPVRAAAGRGRAAPAAAGGRGRGRRRRGRTGLRRRHGGVRADVLVLAPAGRAGIAGTDRGGEHGRRVRGAVELPGAGGARRAHGCGPVPAAQVQLVADGRGVRRADPAGADDRVVRARANDHTAADHATAVAHPVTHPVADAEPDADRGSDHRAATGDRASLFRVTAGTEAQRGGHVPASVRPRPQGRELPRGEEE